MKKKKIKIYAGFSLIELMVAMFILSIIMLVSISVFANIVLVRKNANKSLNSVSAGREAIQLMAKNMRVSSRLGPAGSPNVVYFYSDSLDKCVSYRFIGSTLEGAIENPDAAKNCISGAGVTYNYNPMLDPQVNITAGSFKVVPTSNVVGAKMVGRATITMVIDGKDSLQTTVSFLTYSGII